MVTEADTAAIKEAEKRDSRKKRQEALSWLVQTFPDCFTLSPEGRKPLKLGIHHDIFKHFETINEPLPHSKTKIREALVDYTRRHVYRSSLQCGTPRVNLEGVAEGVVTDEEFQSADHKLKRAAKHKKPRGRHRGHLRQRHRSGHGKQPVISFKGKRNLSQFVSQRLSKKPVLSKTTDIAS